MPDERKPGERNEYRLEYRPIKEYTLPERQPDPPPIITTTAQPTASARPPQPTLTPYPPPPNPRPENNTLTRRTRKRLKRPASITLAFLFLGAGAAVTFTAIWFFVWANVQFFGALFGASPVAGIWFWVLLMVGWGIISGLTWFSLVLFDDLLDVGVRMIHEGTARAMDESLPYTKG